MEKGKGKREKWKFSCDSRERVVLALTEISSLVLASIAAPSAGETRLSRAIWGGQRHWAWRARVVDWTGREHDQRQA